MLEVPTLERVVLSTNRIGDVGAQHVVAALPKFQTLSMLDLSVNHIGNAGAAPLADLFANGFGEKGTPHPSLTELLLNDNDIGPTTKRHVRSKVMYKQGNNFKLYI